ncbi:hypothetical protein BDZ89DRAFT_1193697 [Hymenopellis radicata]|nr:hypothetical protein BDZ89DRAFT_1193697 [Hymenopellis radicata]
MSVGSTKSGRHVKSKRKGREDEMHGAHSRKEIRKSFDKNTVVALKEGKTAATLHKLWNDTLSSTASRKWTFSTSMFATVLVTLCGHERRDMKRWPDQVMARYLLWSDYIMIHTFRLLLAILGTLRFRKCLPQPSEDREAKKMHTEADLLHIAARGIGTVGARARLHLWRFPRSTVLNTRRYLRRTGEWILMGALPLIVKSMAWTAVLACWIALLIVHAKKKRDEGKITPAEKASILDAKENGFVTVAGNGLGLVMIVLGDSLVLWRAWELSSCDVTAKRILVCSGALLLSYIVRFTPETYSARSVIADILLTITPCVGVFVPMATHIIVLIYGSFWDTMEYSGLSASSSVVDSTSMHFAAGSRTSLETSLGLIERGPEDIGEVSKKHLNLDSNRQ